MSPKFLKHGEVEAITDEGRKGLRISGTNIVLEGELVDKDDLPDVMSVIDYRKGWLPAIVCSLKSPSDDSIRKDEIPESALIRKDAEGNIVVHADIEIH